MKTENLYVKRALSLVGTRYKHLGRDHAGIDCLGLMFYAYELPGDDTDEAREAKALNRYYLQPRWRISKDDPLYVNVCDILVRALTKHLVSIRLDQVAPGDTLLFRFKAKQGLGDHVGIFVGNGQFVHSDFRKGVEKEALTQSIERRVVGAYRKS